MIDRKTLDDFRKDFEEAMKPLEAKYGLVVHLCGITYSPDSFHAKFEAKEGASKEDVNKREFEQYCAMYGLDKDDYDRLFEYGGKKYAISGISPSSRKYPVCCICLSDGKTYRFALDLVKRLISHS